MTVWWQHYQTGHDQRETWKSAPAKEVPANAVHSSVLLTDRPASKGMDFSEARYLGDFVIDIDHDVDKGGLTKSIESAQRVADWLTVRCALGEDYVRVYATGKKGFHIVLQHSLLGVSNYGAKNLPAKYKMMAEYIAQNTEATGFDFSIYNAGRGHMLRVPGKKRPDNGKFKVAISLAELKALTAETYQDLVDEPREIRWPDANHACMELCGIFMNLEPTKKRSKQTTGTLSESLTDFSDDNHPECITRLISWTHERPDSKLTFNDYAVQLQVYLKSALLSEGEKEKLVQKFADNGHSTTYNTSELRKSHTENSVGPFVGDRTFSCSAMCQAVHAKDMCGGCPVDVRRMENLTALTQIDASGGGYTWIDKSGQRVPLTDFTICVPFVYSDKDYVGRAADMWLGGDFQLKKADTQIGMVSAAGHNIFLSSQKFIETFTACRGAWINPDLKDPHARMILDHIRRTMSESVIVTPTSSVGLRKHRYVPEGEINLVDTWMWVEPGWAVCSEGMASASHLISDIPNVAKLEKLPVIDIDRAATEKALAHTLLMARPYIIGTIVGWVCSTHLKEHLNESIRQFPLLSIYGPAGSGKTSLASVLSSLGCADYRVKPMVVGEQTPYPIRQAVWETTTVPRIFDEAGSNKCNKRRWEMVRGLLKACYQGSMMQTGMLDPKKKLFEAAGVKTSQQRASSPMIYLSTAPQDGETELLERSVEIGIPKNMRFEGGYEQHFEAVHNFNKEWERLFQVAKGLVMMSLHITDDEAYEMYQAAQKRLPKGFDPRTAVGYTYVILGLTLLKNMLVRNRYAPHVVELVEQITKETEDFIHNGSTEIKQRKTRTEMDNFFATLVDMAHIPDHIGGGYLLKPGIYYLRVNNVLYLNLRALFHHYAKHCATAGMNKEYGSSNSLIKAVGSEPFYLGEEIALNEEQAMTKWYKVDVRMIEDRGTDMSGFQEMR